VTHDIDLLQRLKENELFEMGVHLNLKFLLDGDFRYGKNAQEVIRFFKTFVENPVSIRSHLLAQSGFIFKEELEKEGFKYECNNFV
jgi:hypothetical protein